MYSKLSSSLQTRNYLGLSEAALSELRLDPNYEYLEVGEKVLESEKAGDIVTVELPELNIAKLRGATIEVNPSLHEFGSVSYNPILGSGTQRPTLTVRAYKKAEAYLEWTARIRLLG